MRLNRRRPFEQELEQEFEVEEKGLKSIKGHLHVIGWADSNLNANGSVLEMRRRQKKATMDNQAVAALQISNLRPALTKKVTPIQPTKLLL